jgi:hypothetical protein
MVSRFHPISPSHPQCLGVCSKVLVALVLSQTFKHADADISHPTNSGSVDYLIPDQGTDATFCVKHGVVGDFA